jgi:hypothetical protein
MPGKIFYKEREKIKDGDEKPRFRVVGVFECKLKVYTEHLRMSELEHLAKETGAELVLLKKGERDESKHKKHD